MDDNRFFRLLGRVNAVLFFLACCAVLVFVGGAAATFFAGQPAPVHAAVEAGSGDTYEFGGSLDLEGFGSGTLTRLEGTEEGFMVLRRESRNYRPRLSSDGYRDSANVNVLLFDLRTLRNRWLFAGTKQDIERAYAIRAVVPAPKDGIDPVTALLMPIATKDTNGDGKIDRRDSDSLYLYRPGSTGVVKLFDAVSVSTVEQLDSDRVLVTYDDGKTDRAAMLSAKDFSLIASAAVSPSPH